MANLFDRQKFISGLRARGYNPTNEEIDNYMETMSLTASSSKSYLPYKQKALGTTDDFTEATLERPYEPPKPPESAALDFLGNVVWEAFDVGTFGALGALDYEDYLENLITGGGPTTFAGRVGAGIGGLAGFLVPMGLVKGAAGMAVKGISKYGTRRAGKTMVEKASKELGRTNYKKLSQQAKDSIWQPFTGTMKQYGHSIDDLARREKFFAKLNNEIRPTIAKTLKEHKISPNSDTIGRLEEIIKAGMGSAEGAAMPIWNLQQLIAVGLGGSAGAGKMATLASHVIEEAVIFAAVETPMEIMNAVDEFRDPDIPGAMGHAVALGSALGLIRFIPGGKDQPIIRSAASRLTKMFQGKQSYRSLDYGTEQARSILNLSAQSMYKADKGLFNTAVFSKTSEAFKILGVDRITSKEMIREMANDPKKAKFLAEGLHQIEKNWTKTWWPEFIKESGKDLWGSLGRMSAGAMAFNHEIIFNDDVPLEDKVFNVLVGAFMTKRGRTMDFIDANGKRTQWAHTKRPWTYDNKIKDIEKYLRILGTDSPSLIFDSMVRENKLKDDFISLSDTEDMKAVMNILEKHNVIVSAEEARKPKKKPQSATDHELYDYIHALSGFYVHTNTDKRTLAVDELSLKKLNAIEKDLSKLELVSKPGGGGLRTLADMEDVAYESSKEDTQKLISLYKTAVKDMYAVLGSTELDADKDFVVSLMNASQKKELNSEAQAAIEKIQDIRDLLARYGIIHVARVEDQAVAQPVPKEAENTIIETMARLENDLHHLIYGGKVVHGDFAPVIGDDFLNNVIQRNGIYMSIRDSYSKFQALKSEGDTSVWKDNPRTAKNDSKEVDRLISNLFTDKDTGVLHSRVVLSEDVGRELPADYEAVQEFANTVLKVLPYSSKYKSPTGFGTAGKKTVSFTEMRELRRLFQDNGLGGFTFSGDDLYRYTNEYIGYSIDRKLSSAVRRDGKPFTGMDRAKIGALIQTGLVNEKFETINIVRQIDSLIPIVGDPEIMSKLMDYSLTHSSKGLTLTGNLIDRMFPEASVDIQKQVQDMMIGLEALAKTMNVEFPVIATDLIGKYREHIEPYMSKDGKGILELRTDIVAEANLLTMSELVTKLDMVDQNVMKRSHKELMSEVERYSNKKGLTEEQQAFLNRIRNDFWNRSGDTAKIVSLLANYGHTTEDGDFVPLYNRDTAELNLEFKGAKEEFMQALRDLDQHVPNRLRSELMEQKIKELSKEKLFESDENNTITAQSFLKDYHLETKDKEWLVNILNSNDPFTSLKNEGPYLVDDAGNHRAFEDMNTTEKGQFIDDIIRLSLTVGETRSLKRLTVGEKYGVHADFDNAVTNNPFFRFLDDILGEGNYSIVDRNVQMGIGTRDSRVDSEAQKALVDRLSKGGAAKDVNMRADQGGSTIRMEPLEGHIFMGLGDYSWGIAIPDGRAESLFNKFGEFVISKEKNYKGVYKPIIKKLKEFYSDKGTDELDAEGNPTGKKIFTRSDSEGDSLYIERMATMMWMDKMAGELWWDHLVETSGKDTRESSAAVSKWAKRVRLMSNISSKELSDTHVDRVVKLHEAHNTLEKDTMVSLKALQKNQGLNTIIIKDEGASAKLFSTLKGVLDQINEENNASGMTMRDRDNISSDGSAVHENGKQRADASIADSVMLMPLKWFKALQTIGGFGSMGNSGGLKPLISKTGDVVLFGKTAILPDTRFAEFFEANDKVHAILMDSGAKIKSKNINTFDTSGLTFDQIKSGAIGNQNDYIVHLPWKSVNLGTAVASDHSATISYQLTNEMDASHSNIFYDWLISDAVKKYDKVMARFGSNKNSIGSTAFARTLSDPGTGDNAAMSVMEMWVGASNGGGPVHFTGVMPMFKNSIKKKYLDNGLLQLHNEHGSQSVMSPYLGENWQDLRNTTFKGQGKERTLWTFGQAEIANQNIRKTVDLDRLNFIWHRNKNKDELISYNEFIKTNKGFKKVIQDELGLDELPRKVQLGKVYEVLKRYNNRTVPGGTQVKNFEIAVTFHRTPSTRQSDKIIVGLKGFTKAAEGNQARLNAWDTYARAEADFDIDKINYWWDTPTEILKLWRDQSGKTSFVSEESLAGRSTLDNHYDWLNPASMRDMSTDLAHAEKMKGQVVKAQRIVQFLSQYNSGDEFKGFALDLSGGFRPTGTAKNNDSKIVFDFDKLDGNRHLLAEDIQRIIDSQNGYNKELYANNWLDKFLFGDGGSRYNGLFKKVFYDSESKEWGEGPKLDNAEQPTLGKAEREIIKAVISPYKTLLQLGTSIYEGGEARSPRYDDLITGIETYDSNMGRLPSRVYYKLRRQFGNPKNEGFDENLMARVNQIFRYDPTGKPKDTKFNPLGEFGSNAKTQKVAGVDTEATRKLPFERMLATVAKGEYLSQDNPKSLWGDDLAQFDNFYNRLLGAGADTELRTTVYSEMAKGLQSDMKNMKFLNYLRWQEGRQTRLLNNAKKDGFVNQAARITEELAEITSTRMEAEKNIKNDEGVIKTMLNVAVNRMKRDIINNPGGNEHSRSGRIPKFTDFNHAKNWINKNTKKLFDLASERPIKYRAINSPEYRDALIFHEMLSKYENIFIDPTVETGRRFEEFNNDQFKFDGLRRDMWKMFFGDKKRVESFEPWWNETRIMNTLTNEFTGLYKKWEAYQPGLGDLFLWKAMMPRPIQGEYTYFNGKLAPAFRESDMSMVKFGLRFIASADKSMIAPFKKRMLFDVLTSQYTDWYDFLYSNKIGGKEGMTYRDMYDQASKDLYDNPSPLIDYDRKGTEPSQAVELNDIVKHMYGADGTYSYGFVMLDPKSAGAIKARTQHHVFPRGYIPINYKGGEHPRIKGWSDWNKAREGEAYLMLGEALNKKILGYREYPIIKHTFNEVNGRSTTDGDMRQIIKEKGQHEEQGFNPDC